MGIVSEKSEAHVKTIPDTWISAVMLAR